MENNSIVLWQNSNLPVIPKKVVDVSELVAYGVQLSKKDQNQIIKAYNDESYEMVTTYIWTKAINFLKNQLSKVGISFIAEMLDRPDINDHTDIQQAITEYEALRLSEELGVISGTASFRLKRTMETVAHFNQLDLDEDPENDLTEEEAKSIIRSCIQGVLGANKIEIAIDFKNFRDELENSTLTEDSSSVLKLLQSPYFFHRTTIRTLLSIIKSASGAQLENSLANSNLIIPKIWNNLKHPEKYQVGRGYSELFADGKTKASSGLKQVLLKVRGFDFVPEDLRSSSFIKAANEILKAHEGFNNFYNEPAPTNNLSRMGSVIPIPAFSICLTAVLCVKLGNSYGVSDAAQESANNIIRGITHERWIYFFNECIQSNDRLLYKLTIPKPTNRWLKLFNETFYDRILPEIKQKEIINLLKYSKEGKIEKIHNLAKSMYSQLGYATT
ncbi:hypothetical protein WBJ53_32815 (plasmid) [Spirosoma sp. SC4-14]|uniref:hypothetical protein n=1 Tax=Spirosoma sp. SC4-14 TaxID=3128900 RepID=UPI0030D45359